MLCILYAACAFFVTKNAKASLVVGLGIFVLLKIGDALVDPFNIVRGFIVTIIILYFLIKAVSAAFKLDKINQQLMNLGISRNEIDQSRELVEYERTQEIEVL